MRKLITTIHIFYILYKMVKSKFFPLLILILGVYFLSNEVKGHGRLLKPASTSSLWRFGEFQHYNPPINYNDHQLFCGGFQRQYEVNGGRCGICGDDYSDPIPRDNEPGGHYGRGIKTANFTMNQKVNLQVQITAAHRGFMEFEICPQNNPPIENKFVKLHRADGQGTKFPVDKTGFYDLQYMLPRGMTCNHCVFRWEYKAGNNWGDCGNGTGAVGCGNQETFRACADVAIRS